MAGTVIPPRTVAEGIVQFTRGHDAGARDVDQDAAQLRSGPNDLGDVVDIVGAGSTAPGSIGAAYRISK
jgi:hypothetical protein